MNSNLYFTYSVK